MIKNYPSKIKNLTVFTSALAISSLFPISAIAQSEQKQALHDIANSISATNIENDITTLVNFGTRHTLSETESDTRGIGAARRWIKSEFEKFRQNAAVV